jgi:hypothetical protein
VSTSVNPSRGRVGPARAPLPRPRLTVVPRGVSRAPRLPFVLLVVSVLAAGLVGLLLLNTSMERGAYSVTALRQRSTALGIDQQALQLKVAALQDPQMVAQQALALGMVQELSPAFVRLGSGEVLGHPVPGAPGDQPDIGSKIGRSVDRLAKIAPVVAGEANTAGTTVVKPPLHRTKTPDTVATSPASSH